jgi:hypothetical protein
MAVRTDADRDSRSIISRMNLRIACMVLMVACGNSGDNQAKPAAQETNAPSPPPPTESKPAPTPPPETKPAKPPEPEPTTPAEIEKAFKQAMIEGREKDVLKYCGMLKLDGKSNPQSLMGCALAACRAKDGDTAKRYAGQLSASKTGKQLLVQVQKVCASNNVAM